MIRMRLHMRHFLTVNINNCLCGIKPEIHRGPREQLLCMSMHAQSSWTQRFAVNVSMGAVTPAERPRALTCASNVRPEWHRFSALHRMKPGRISSSSMPFSRSLRFSPGPASSVSTSSESRLNTSTTCCTYTENRRVSTVPTPKQATLARGTSLV